MLHHVALEVPPDLIRTESRFWIAVGFTAVEVPPALGPGYAWFERDGTQIHLLQADPAVVPDRGHVAVIAPDFEATLVALRDAGFTPREGRQLWGERRAKVSSPAGHIVELIAAPPASSAGST